MIRWNTSRLKNSSLNCLFRLASTIRKMYWFFSRSITIGVKVIVTSQNQILLIKNRYDTFWYLPGGGIKSKETVVECAQRELWEECGIKADTVKILSVYSSFLEYKSDHIVLMHTDVSNQSLAQGLEIEKIAFFDRNDLPADASYSTKKRIGEFCSGVFTCGEW